MRVKIIILSIIILLLFDMNIYASALEERLNLSIDIRPYVDMNILNDIDINLERPWAGGEIKEAKSELCLKTNTDVELSWECTGLKNEATGRLLPLGIPEKLLNLGEKDKGFVDQPFGLTANLVKKGAGTAEKQKNQYVSYIDENEVLRSQDKYNFDPGTHDFDIILQYYWSTDGKWSEIRAGEYTGQIIFTVSAPGDSSVK